VATGVSTRCTVDDRQAVNRPRVVDLSYDGFAVLGRPSIGLIEVRMSW
jgi:rare lipoprotein A (peptidoglycan hydrolase)